MSLSRPPLRVIDTAISTAQDPHAEASFMVRPGRRHGLVLGLVVALASWSLTGVGQSGAKNGEWRAYRGDEASTAYSAADLITRDNAKNLQVAWTWKFDNYGGAASETLNTETTPLMVNGVLYFTAGAR